MTSLPPFRHLTPPMRIFAGEDALAHLAAELDRARLRRAVVVCGRTLAADPAGAERVRATLGERCVGLFSGVRPHSPAPTVEAAAESLRTLEADAVIALGGGSAVVTARAAAILLAEQKPLRDLCTRFPPGAAPVSPRLAREKLPQFVVPTTPTTAIVKAGSAVLDPDTGQRMTLFDPKTRAQAVFVDPALAAGAPHEVVLDAALNATTMAVQGLDSRVGTPLSDAPLLHALRLLKESLPAECAGVPAAATRVPMILAAILCGQGSDHAPPGLAGVLGHCIGARRHLANGTVNAIVLPHVLRFNAGAGRLAVALGADAAAHLAAECVAFFRGLGVPNRLRDLGVAAADLPQAAEDAMADWFLRQNSRSVADAADILAVLRDAW